MEALRKPHSQLPSGIRVGEGGVPMVFRGPGGLRLGRGSSHQATSRYHESVSLLLFVLIN